MLKKTVSRHFQEFYFPGFTMVVTFNHKGTKCPLVLCQIRLSVFLLLLQLSQTWKTEYYLPITHPSPSVYSAWLPFLSAPQGRLSRLTIVGRSVKAHAGVPSSPSRPSQRKMTETFGPGVDWAIHLSCNHPDISCCRTSWSAGAGTCQIFPRVVDLSFIKRERGFMQLKGINRLKCYLFAIQPNRTLFYFGQ